MTRTTEQDDAPSVSPEHAFALLGNETRIDIIQALGEISDKSLSFSELRNQVDVADSGQFNYHLKKLTGSFIHQTDQRKYKLTYAGDQVIGAIFSGTFDQRNNSRVIDLDSTCTTCGSGLIAEYKSELVSIRCTTCDDQKSTFGFPPGAFENRTNAELEGAFDTWIRLYLSALQGEYCLNCSGRIRGSIIDNSEYLDEHEVGIEHACERCTNRSVNSVGAYLLYQPIVVAFHYDHDINLDEIPLWQLEWLHEEETTILSLDPWRIQFSSSINGNRLEVELDENLFVSVI
ncbi:winged helix-turn-helix domain-containing protein [Haladaptatus sp. CMAA 1911]|uniref:winged helix-turn-helix domain-containing protein n=1 Tax=unclassified Haladaptatus TaxID=2622732 RepID=UPI0037545899